LSDPYWPDFNDLWDYGDPAGSEAVFRSLIPQAEHEAESFKAKESYYLQLLTQVARTLGLQKKFAEAHTILDQVEERMGGLDLVEVRYQLERGRIYNSSGQPDRAVPLFLSSARLGEELGADFYTVDALHMLGIAASGSERLEWNLKAIALAEKSADEHARDWMGSLSNNTGWAFFDEGRYVEALAHFQKSLIFRQEQGDQELIDVARWCVAKTFRILGRLSEALEIQLSLEDPYDPDGFVEEEIAECLLALGRTQEAQPYFARAFTILSQLDSAAADEQRMERLRALGGG
jgi:tetratricopeptide (TPR) repeat protein